jgi:PAS domain S-box-containing protein
VRHSASSGGLGDSNPPEDLKQENALSDAARLQLFIDAVTDYAIFTLDPGGLVTSWNSGAQRIKGYAASEILGQHFSCFYSEADRAAGVPARALQTAMESGRHEAEGWRVRKDGTPFWASAVIDAVRDPRGVLIGFAKVTRDISERRAAQATLQRAQEQLSYSQKMEALGELTGGVAHDFNNLLMIIGGNLRIVRKLLQDEARGMRAAEAIEIAVKRGETLTRQLLAFSRRQPLSPVVVDLSERIDKFRSLLVNSLGPKMQLTAAVAPETWPVEVDVSELELALVNIAVNARDAMPDGGVIAITAENVRLSRGQVPGDLTGDFVALAVTDNGVGIPEDVLAKVFDPFFTTKGAGKGSGLGLSQVYGFARQSGGAVTVNSETGKGTKVTIYLPRSLGDVHRASLPEAPVESATGGLVLLVEDNPVVADVSATMLGELGFRVDLAIDSKAALQAINSDKKFDLMFSDIVMAGPFDGVALARIVRQRCPDLPILLATGYSNAALAARDEFSILRKPYQIGQLSAAIAKVMAEARQANIGGADRSGRGAQQRTAFGTSSD